jgi:methyltransferase-like protein
MIVTISDKFFDNFSIVAARNQCGYSSEFIRVWCSTIKLALQQGEGMANIIKIKRRVELPPSYNVGSNEFKSMVDNGLIQTTDSKGKLSPEMFEEWWKAYPFRISNGKKIKIGKAKARKLFDNLITTEEEYKELIQATNNYSLICNKLPKDPERFLRSNFWHEYYESDSANNDNITNVVKETDGSALNEMLNK